MKYNVIIEETRVHQHEIEIEVDDCIDEDELNELFDEAESKSFLGWEAIPDHLKKQDGIKVTDIIDDEDGSSEEIRIDDYSVIN